MTSPNTTHAQEIEQCLSSIIATPSTLELLRNLHTQALAEPAFTSTDTQPELVALDRFVALDPDKCAAVYLLLRATGATNIIEAGTSFGVSTIYLALAVKQNAAVHGGKGRVIATENEPSKAMRAREHWAGTEVEDVIELREGDLRETLKEGLGEVELLLLDIWTPLALPTLKLVKPKMKIGAVVIADNTIMAKAGYVDMMEYLNDPVNGFKMTTMPYSGGLLMAVYLGKQGGIVDLP